MMSRKGLGQVRGSPEDGCRVGFAWGGCEAEAQNHSVTDIRICLHHVPWARWDIE